MRKLSLNQVQLRRRKSESQLNKTKMALSKLKKVLLVKKRKASNSPRSNVKNKGPRP